LDDIDALVKDVKVILRNSQTTIMPLSDQKPVPN
jgi:hypothetical protein